MTGKKHRWITKHRWEAGKGDVEATFCGECGARRDKV